MDGQREPTKVVQEKSTTHYLKSHSAIEKDKNKKIY
jgi:hypothetical protein